MYHHCKDLSGGWIRPKIAVMALLGDNLRRLRKKAGLTQAQVAAEVDVLPHNYVPFETGKKLPSDDALKRIAGVLQAPYEDLLHFKEADEVIRKYNPKVLDLLFEGYKSKPPEEAGKLKAEAQRRLKK